MMSLFYQGLRRSLGHQEKHPFYGQSQTGHTEGACAYGVDTEEKRKVASAGS
jgi:hypothetical protein